MLDGNHLRWIILDAWVFSEAGDEQIELIGKVKIRVNEVTVPDAFSEVKSNVSSQ